MTFDDLVEFRFTQDRIKWWWSFWWYCMTATEIVLPWPAEFIKPDEYGDCYFSSDPNEIWRPELESNVGTQHIDWDWDIDKKIPNAIAIKFRRGKKDWATYFKLKWS